MISKSFDTFALLRKEAEMSRYTRTTRECPVSQLHPELYQAVQVFFQTHNLGEMDFETRRCCETVSVKQDSNRLISFLEGNLDRTSRLAILMTSEWLIWVRSGDLSGIHTTGAKLKAIRAKTFVTKKTDEMQLDLSGFIADTKEYVRGTLELGPEPAAQSFCEDVERTILKENPPEKRNLPRWMGG
jgi:hypothetical protein